MFGTRYQVHRMDRGTTENVRAVALVGARTCRSAELILSGAVDAFTIVFQPGAFSTLFQLPVAELTNADFDGEEVLGRRISELYARLGEVSAFYDRVRVADCWLAAARPAGESVSAVVRSAMAMIRTSGSVRVSEPARQTGLGIRQFERRFDHEIGISPKLYALIIRFEAALQRRAVSPTTRWTDRPCSGLSRPDAYGARFHPAVRRQPGGDRPSAGHVCAAGSAVCGAGATVIDASSS